MATVEMLTIDEACARRKFLLESLGCDYEALRDRGDAYLLDANELAVLTEIEELNYLIDTSR